MEEHKKFRESLLLTLAFLAVLWLIKSWEYSAEADLSFLGIYPRTISGSIGILTSPFIHGDLHHLISNSFPLLFLGVGLLFFYRAIAFEVFTIIYLSTGLWVWAVARPAFHIGASGLVYGLAAFLFFIGLLRKDARSLAVSMVVIFLYHGLFAGIFPLVSGVSWESHLLGGCSGLMCAIYFRARIPVAELSPLSLEQEQTAKAEEEREWILRPGDEPLAADKTDFPTHLHISFRNSTDEDRTDSRLSERDSANENDDIIQLR